MPTGDEERPPSPAGNDPVSELDRALADLDAVRRRVVNVVGHVLRTPVTTIAGMAAELQAAVDDETRAELLRGLARNAERLERLLDDLLVAAEVNTALPVGDPEPTAIIPVLTGAWRTAGRGDELTIEGPPVEAIVRRASLERIVAALLDNALKYGHGPVTVRISTTAKGVRVEIESSGDGPNDEELSHAFEPLYRGEHAVMTTPGLGLGLAVSRALARAEGGDVTLERREPAIVAVLDLPA